MATRSKTPKTLETVPTNREAYHRQVNSRFGKVFNTSADRQNNNLFDRGLPEDQMLQRSLAPWVVKTAVWNQIQRDRGRPATTKPLNALEEVQRKAVLNNRNVIEKYGEPAPYDMEAIRKRWGQRLMGIKGEAYRKAVADPNRPVRDWDARRVSPKYYNPKTGKYDLFPGVK